MSSGFNVCAVRLWYENRVYEASRRSPHLPERLGIFDNLLPEAGEEVGLRSFSCSVVSMATDMGDWYESRVSGGLAASGA